MTATTHDVQWTAQAQMMLSGIKDERVQRAIIGRVRSLSTSPETQGKPLTGELSGLRAVRAAGQRYRIVYRVHRRAIVVLVVAVGIRKGGKRKDVYELTQKLLQLGLLEPDE